MKIRLVMLGKARRSELRALVEEYLERVRRFAPVECTELKHAAALDRMKRAPVFVLLKVLLGL